MRECSPPTTCHMSRVTCHVSCVMCHVSHVFYIYIYVYFFLAKMVKLIGGGKEQKNVMYTKMWQIFVCDNNKKLVCVLANTTYTCICQKYALLQWKSFHKKLIKKITLWSPALRDSSLFHNVCVQRSTLIILSF